jgi:hypothetical protein
MANLDKQHSPFPRFRMALAREWDAQVFCEFLAAGNSTIVEVFPEVKSQAEVLALVNKTYQRNLGKLEATCQWLEQSQAALAHLAQIISQILKCAWEPNTVVTIIPVVCPVSPRFIETATFMVGYYYDHDWILHVCAHELTHFLYFQQLTKLSSEKIVTEYPSADWLLSELVAPVVVNQPAIQALVHSRDSFYAPDPSIITKAKQQAITKLFLQRTDLLTFRQQALEIINRD